MSNTRLLQAALPAERMRGAKFCEDFRDHLTMIKGGWTLTGAPTFAKNGGMILNGSSQSAMIPIQQELGAASLTYHIEFYPAFAHDDNVNRILFDTVGGRSLINKAANNYLDFFSGATVNTIHIPPATIAPLWKINGRNVLSYSTVSGSNFAWLNGVQIGWGAAAWTIQTITGLRVGSHVGGTAFYWSGTISRFYIGHHTSTIAEHQAYYNRTMWNWEDRCLLNLQMRTGDYDPTAVRTLDSSGNGLHATLGDGVTPTKYPTQSKGCMTFDGGDYLNCGDAAALRLTNTGSVLVTFRPATYVPWNILVSKNQWSSDRNGYTIYQIVTGGAVYGELSDGANYILTQSPTAPALGRWHTVALVWNGSLLTLYIDGVYAHSRTQPINPTSDGYSYTVGKAANSGYYSTCSIADNKVLKEALNATQVCQYHIDQMSRLGAEQ